MGEDREGHPIWYDNFNYDFRGKYMMHIHVYSGFTHYNYIHSSQTVFTMYLCRTALFSEIG